MKWRFGLLLAAIAFVIGLILMAPARLFESTINRAAVPHAAFAAIDGSIWSGVGTLKVAALGEQTIPITWDFSPAALLRLELGFLVRADSPTLTGSASIGAGFGDMVITNTALRADLKPLLAKHRGLAVMSPNGFVNITTSATDRIKISLAAPHYITGTFNARVEDFSLRTLLQRPIAAGDIRFVVRDSVGEYKVTQSTGALKLDGGGVVPFAAHGEFRYTGTLTPDRQLPATLTYVVRALGAATPDGGVQVNYRTSW